MKDIDRLVDTYITEKKKYADCNTCGVESVFSQSKDNKGKPIWKCNNCGEEKTRRVLNTKHKQERAKKHKEYDDLINQLTR